MAPNRSCATVQKGLGHHAPPTSSLSARATTNTRHHRLQPADGGKLPVLEAPTGEASSGTSGGSDNENLKSQQQEVLPDICSIILKTQASSKELEQTRSVSQQQNQAEGTSMHHPQIPDGVDCESAIDHWKGDVSKFSTLPPAYSTGVDVYGNHTNISFVGPLNTGNSSTGACSLIICKPAPAGAEVDGNAESSDTVAGDLDGRPPSTTGSKYILLCLTNSRL
ncbi:hypothetical protein Efla_004323 [Eimeria flavescens]